MRWAAPLPTSCSRAMSASILRSSVPASALRLMFQHTILTKADLLARFEAPLVRCRGAAEGK